MFVWVQPPSRSRQRELKSRRQANTLPLVVAEAAARSRCRFSGGSRIWARLRHILEHPSLTQSDRAIPDNPWKPLDPLAPAVDSGLARLSTMSKKANSIYR